MASKLEERTAARRSKVLSLYQSGMKVPEIARARHCSMAVIISDLTAMGIDAGGKKREYITVQDIEEYKKSHGVGTVVNIEKIYNDEETGHQRHRIIKAKILEVHKHNALTTAGNYRWPDIIVMNRKSA